MTNKNYNRWTSFKSLLVLPVVIVMAIGVLLWSILTGKYALSLVTR